MAAQVTLAAMIALVRRATDQESSTAVTDTEITAWINQGGKDVHQEVAQANPDWFTTTSQLSTTAGTLSYNMYSLSPMFMLIRGVDLVDGDDRHTCRPYAFAERNRYRNAPAIAARISLPRYRMIGQGGSAGTSPMLVFDRDPGTNTYDVHYVPTYRDLSDPGNDTYDGILGFEDWPIEHACALVRNKMDETEAAMLHLQRIATMKERVRRLAQERHQDGAPIVAKTRRRYSSFDEIDEVW